MRGRLRWTKVAGVVAVVESTRAVILGVLGEQWSRFRRPSPPLAGIKVSVA